MADIRHFYHSDSGTLSYVVADPATKSAAIIDPVLGFDIVSGRTDDSFVNDIAAFIEAEGLQVEWILETHAHADHLSGAPTLASRLGGRIAIGRGIRDVQRHFADIFHLGPEFAPDGSQFDHLFADSERFRIGELEAEVIATPGHTSDSLSYRIGDAVFVGDSLFMPDGGTARCDFPGGDAGVLYDSIQRLLVLPADTRIFVCHDYGPGGREMRYCTTVAEQAANNIHVGGGRSREDFIALREARDATLSLPKLILPSIQVNIRAGRLPEAEANGRAYLKIPLDTL